MTKQNGDNCGWPTAEDTACKHPPTEDNGRCWLHADDDREIGRPSKFNHERAEDAIEAARQSKSKSGCARAAGVELPTLNRWLDKNPDLDDGREFRSAFAQARRDGETVLVQGGLRNDEVDTSMAKFLLATSFDYKETKEIEHSGEAAQGVVIHTEAATDGDG